MWTREQLKANAKSSLSRFHWTAVLVCLIVVLLGGAGSSGLNFNLNLNDGSSWVRWAIPTFAAIGATSTLVGILVGNVAAVGSARFFLIGRERIPTTEIMFDPFRANYGGILLVMFLRGLFTALWSLLLVVPGIVKGYAWRLVPYLLAENPNLDYRRALDLSAAMMDGHKMDVFVLDLSFFGWNLLSAATAGILGVLYVNPYVAATNAELYIALRTNAFAAGITGPEELPGVGV